MSTKRTIINADEELVIKGKLTIEGNVTQIETTQQVTNLEGNVFTINSDSSNTSAVLALNSNGTVASFTFDSANGSIVVDKPLNFGSQNISTAGNVVGAYFHGNVRTANGIITSQITETANLWFTTARARAAISHVDAGGDGSFAYDSANGIFTYTGPNQAEANARIDAYLSGGDGIDYANGTIDVDSTVIRTTGSQTISGEKTFTGQVNITTNIIPTTANTYDLGSWTNHFGNVFANIVHAEKLDLGDADLSDIHSTFYAGTPTGTILNTNTAGGLTYAHNSPVDTNPGGYYRVNTGAGLEIDSNGALKIDSTVITTAGGTINGDLTINGQLNYQNVVDSYVANTIITLNANAIVNNHVSIVAYRPTANDVEIRWNETESRWQFTNDGNTYVNIVEISDLDDGNGLVLNGNGLLAVGAGDGITVDADNVSVNSTVVRTTGNQSIANVKTFTGELVIPSTIATSNGAIFYDSANSQAFIRINGNNLEITPASLVGDVEDVGSTGINLYAGSRELPGSSATVTQSLIAAKVGLTANIVADGNITGFTSIFDTTSIVSGNTFVTPANVSYVELSGLLEHQGYLGGQTITVKVYKNGSLIHQQVDDRDDNGIQYGDTYFTTGPIQTTSGDIFSFQVAGLDTQDQAGGKGIQTTYTYLAYKALLSTPTVEASKVHGIKSIDAGSYLSISEASNVVTIAGNISAIRGSLNTANVSGYGGISYSSANGVFSYFGVTDAQIRTLFSASGLLSYNASIGAFTTSADNYGSWTVQTDSGAGAAESITSGEKLTIQSGTGISVTNTGNVITITNSNTADITGVSAGDGLTGGGNSGDVTLNVAAGDGIIVNADNVAVNVAYVRNQFSAAGDLSYNATTGVFSFTNDAGDIESVTAGNGLIGGGTSGAVTLNIGAGTGITVNADNIAVNMSAFSTTDLAEGANLYYTTARANSAMNAYLVGGAGLTYSSGTFAVGAGDGITVNADNVALTSGIITTGAKTYGSASQVPAITIDTYGRVTSVSNTSISITASQVSDFTSAANTAIDNRIVGGSGLTYSSGTLAVGAGSYITVAADAVSVDATTTNTASKVVARDGSGNVYANYFVGTATAAQYADLAENYLADGDYLPGTVLVFGGDAEVTASISYESTRVAGVVTTQPAHVMNSHLTGDNVACIALRGRVPVKVKGVVRKGDVLVSAGEGHIGYAVAALDPRSVPAAAIVGKAITDKLDAGPGVVEALI